MAEFPSVDAKVESFVYPFWEVSLVWTLAMRDILSLARRTDFER